jgi:SEL1 protein
MDVNLCRYKQGHVMAKYNLAMMQLAGLGLPVSCKNAASLLKGVAERGPWWGCTS